MGKFVKFLIGHILRTLGCCFIIIWDIRVASLAAFTYSNDKLNIFVLLCFVIGVLQLVEIIFISNIGMDEEEALENKLFLRPLMLIPTVAVVVGLLFPYIR